MNQSEEIWVLQALRQLQVGSMNGEQQYVLLRSEAPDRKPELAKNSVESTADTSVSEEELHQIPQNPVLQIHQLLEFLVRMNQSLGYQNGTWYSRRMEVSIHLQAIETTLEKKPFAYAALQAST